MAIKYKTITGSDDVNRKARIHKAQLLPLLKGMKCNNCKGIDSKFTFDYFREGQGTVVPTFHACCDEFDRKVKTAMGIKL